MNSATPLRRGSATRLRLPPLPALLAYLSAGLFVLASGGANVLFGVSKGNGSVASSAVWAAVSIAVTLGGALSWPAFTTSIEARRVGRASVALIGILVFTSYGIVAALGSAAGSRMDATTSERHASQRMALARAAHNAAKAELATIPTGRTEAELRPLIASLKATPGANDCQKVDGPVSRTICPQVASLEAEAARAVRRATLQGELQKAAETLSSDQQGKTANPDAKALATFLAALGLDWSEERISRVLTLLAVLVIECGAGLSLALAASLSRPACNLPPELPRHAETATVVGSDAIVVAPEHPPAGTASVTPVTAGIPSTVAPPNATTRELVLAFVRDAGGTVRLDQRGLAGRLGVAPSTVNRAIAGLQASGTIVKRTSATGSVLALA